MIYKIAFSLFLILTSAFFLHTYTPLKSPPTVSLIILNMQDEPILPRNFRTTNDPFKMDSEQPPTRQGMEQLHISGSAQFSHQSFQKMQSQLNLQKPLFIIDLRQESHGFLNGSAISWYAPKDWGNRGKSLNAIILDEKQKLGEALKQGSITVYRIIKKDLKGIELPETLSIPIKVQTASVESEIVNQHGAYYHRIPVTDHLHPSNESVDQFINLVRRLPQERWIHFHCAAGVGRTTTFMAMYDMMFNAKKVSFQDIIKRQWLIGGLNLEKTSNKHPWKSPHAVDRLEFLEKFYHYCQTNQNNFEDSWSLYIQEVEAYK